MAAKASYGKWFFYGVISAAVAGGLLLPATAHAGLLASDANAELGWHDTKPYIGNPFPFLTDKIIGNMDYAVYRPGKFDLSFPDQDPSEGAEYVYAYQFFCDPTSTDKVVTLTVGLDGDETPSDIMWIEEDPDNPSGVEPDMYWFGGTVNPTSALWSFDAGVSSSEKSKILIFTSPFGPQKDLATLSGESSAKTWLESDGLPSPVPEPLTLLSLAIAGGLFILVYTFSRK
jgi:hypothetical protein